MKVGGASPYLPTSRAQGGAAPDAPGAASAASATHTPATREVEPRRTAVSKDDLRAAIGRALQRETGTRPDARLVDTLTAHASLETASGDRMYNFNFAGIKGASPAGTTAVLRTKEVLDGREVSIKDGFRAYASLDDGARDYVHLMRTRFAGAMAPASRGDLDGFAHALKQSGYYTAAEKDYAKGLASLSPSGAAAGAGAKASSGLSVSLAHVHDALDAARWSVGLDGGSPSASGADVFDALSSAPSPRGHRVTDDEEDDA
jgi:hypothetical protein